MLLSSVISSFLSDLSDSFSVFSDLDSSFTVELDFLSVLLELLLSLLLLLLLLDVVLLLFVLLSVLLVELLFLFVLLSVLLVVLLFLFALLFATLSTSGLMAQEQTASEAFPMITIPESITTIENHAFKGGSFKSITLHDNITELGIFAFAHCDNIEEVVETIETERYS